MVKTKGRRGAYKKKTPEPTVSELPPTITADAPQEEPTQEEPTQEPMTAPTPAPTPVQESEPDPEQQLLDAGMGWGSLDHYDGDDGFKEPSHNVPFGTSNNSAPNIAGMWQLLHTFFDFDNGEDGKIVAVNFKNRDQKPFFVGRSGLVPSYSSKHRVFSKSAITESGEKYVTKENPLSKKKGYFCEISLQGRDRQHMAKMALYVILSFCGNDFKSFTGEELNGLHCMTVEPNFKKSVGRIRIWVDDSVKKQMLESELTSRILDEFQGYTISTDRSWMGANLSTNA